MTESAKVARRRTILAFDGGGVRGAFSVAFLERIEALLGAGDGQPLARRIDLAGGTSTGAIIAGAVALGYGAAEIRDFYLTLAPRIFRRSRFRLPGVQSVFDAAALKREILTICGDRRLDSADLLCGYALVMKRMDTGSAWIVSNNPAGRFWNDPADGSFIGNRHYRLADLIRASTAAPHYFQPHAISVAENAPPGLFVDGGVTPHNTPALALLQMVTIPGYGYRWPLGAERLRIISIGTGGFRDRLSSHRARRMPSALLAMRALAGLIQDTQVQTLTLMQMLGRPVVPQVINSEIGDMDGYLLPPDPLFEFLRYDIRLEDDWLRDTLGVTLKPRDLMRLRQMDNPDIVPEAYALGQIAAERLVRPEHFAPAAADLTR